MKKGLIALGPGLLLISLGSVLSSALAMLIGLGLVGGLFFGNKQVSKSSLIAKISLLIIISLAIIALVYFVMEYQLIIGMLFGTLGFFIIISLLSINSLKKDFKKSFIAIIILTIIFLIISEASIFIASIL